MARKSLSSQVMTHQQRAKSILEGVFRVSDGAMGELVLQALEELAGIAALCERPAPPAARRPKKVPTSTTPLGTAFAGDALAVAQRRTRKAVAKP